MAIRTWSVSHSIRVEMRRPWKWRPLSSCYCLMLNWKYKPYFGMTSPCLQIHIYFQVRLPNVFDRDKTFHFHAWIPLCFSSLFDCSYHLHWCILDSKNIHYWEGWLFQSLSPFPAERKCMCKTVMKYFWPFSPVLHAGSLRHTERWWRTSFCCPKSYCQFYQHSSLLRSVPLVSDFSFLRLFWGKCNCSTHSFYL